MAFIIQLFVFVIFRKWRLPRFGSRWHKLQGSPHQFERAGSEDGEQNFHHPTAHHAGLWHPGETQFVLHLNLELKKSL